MFPVAVARSSSDDNALTLCTFGFLNDVTVSHNRANKPESYTTLCFLRVRQVATPVRRQITLCLVEFASKGSEVAAYDCSLV